MKPLKDYGILDDDPDIDIYADINNLVQDRIRQLDQIYADQEDKHGSGDIPPDYSQVDYLKKLIIEELDRVKTYAPIDFILEVFDTLGFALNLINDDDGHWAIGDGGVSSVNTDDDEPSDYVSTNFVEKYRFADSIREAVVKYIREIQDENN